MAIFHSYVSLPEARNFQWDEYHIYTKPLVKMGNSGKNIGVFSWENPEQKDGHCTIDDGTYPLDPCGYLTFAMENGSFTDDLWQFTY